MPRATWLNDVKQILAHVGASDATEVEYARQGFRLRIKRRRGARRAAARPDRIDESRAAADSAVLAPLTGVFYRAPSPEAAPYLTEGDEVRPDTVVGLIETMKVFNEVLAERHGRVRTILVDSGQLVHAGDRLLLIEETGETVSERRTPTADLESLELGAGDSDGRGPS